MLNVWISKCMFLFVYIHVCPLEALQYISEKKTYNQALDDCHMKGNGLVKIDTVSKYEVVKNFMEQKDDTEDVWIDLLSLGNQYDVYFHSDEQVATFFMWDKGEPGNQYTDRCIRLAGDTLRYRTRNCEDTYRSLCDTSDDDPASPSGDGFPSRKKDHSSDFYGLTTSDTGTSTIDPHSYDNNTDNCEVCECNINYNSINDPVVLEAMKERIVEIKLTLSLNKSDLSKQVRRKISAPDERTSSKLLGCVGILFLLFSFGVIVVPDTVELVRFWKDKIKAHSQTK